MQMQLKQAHIEAAIRDFVAKAGIQFPIDEINFTAGRGKDGLTATIDLEDPFATLLDSAAGEEEAPAPKAKPAKAEPKPAAAQKEEPTPAQETANEPEFAETEEEEAPFSDPQPAQDPIPEPPKASGSSLFS